MNYTELEQALSRLDRVMYDLENTYIENEGECTEETDKMEEEISCIGELLTTEGVDMLGRWLKAKEDKRKSLKAEKDYLTRQMTAIDNTIDFIKSKVLTIMHATGQEKVKGNNGYSFAAGTSTTTSVDNDVLMDTFAKPLATLQKKLPADVSVVLKASVSLADKDNLPVYYVQQIKPSCRFAKPRASKE